MWQETEGIRLRPNKSETGVNKNEKLGDGTLHPDNPCHVAGDSLLTGTTGFNKYNGLLNWACLIFAVGGILLLVQNKLKYGHQLNPLQLYLYTRIDDTKTDYGCIILLLFSSVPILLCFLTEKGLSMNLITHSLGILMQVVNLLILILAPVIASYLVDGFSLIPGLMVNSMYFVLFLKLWSYVQVNMWCRNDLQTSNAKDSLLQSTGGVKNTKDVGSLVHYPNNLTIKDLSYFVVAPTLCYELNFPRTKKIRKIFLLKCFIEVIVAIHLIVAIIQQYMAPVIKNSLISFSDMDIISATKRLLILMIPNHLADMCLFYFLFHSLLNFMGELFYFADRNFYYDWWNANNTDTFWNTWNMVLQRWCNRHLNLLSIEASYGRLTANIVVFFINGLFQEYVISLPLRTFKIWLLAGMFVQIPYLFLSSYMEKTFGQHMGNAIVWLALLVGQPILLLIYFYDYTVEHFGKTIAECTYI